MTKGTSAAQLRSSRSAWRSSRLEPNKGFIILIELGVWPQQQDYACETSMKRVSRSGRNQGDNLIVADTTALGDRSSFRKNTGPARTCMTNHWVAPQLEKNGTAWSLTGGNCSARQAMRGHMLVAEGLELFRESDDNGAWINDSRDGDYAHTEQSGAGASILREDCSSKERTSNWIERLSSSAALIAGKGNGAGGLSVELRTSVAAHQASLSDRDEYDRTIATIRAQLDEATFATAWAAGHALSLEQAIAEALAISS